MNTTWSRAAFHRFPGRQLPAINATAAYIMCDVRGPKQSRQEKWRTRLYVKDVDLCTLVKTGYIVDNIIISQIILTVGVI